MESVFPQSLNQHLKKICSVNIPPSAHSLEMTSIFDFQVVVDILTNG